MVSFMCQFHWAKGAHVAVKTLFLGVFVRVLLHWLPWFSGLGLRPSVPPGFRGSPA